VEVGVGAADRSTGGVELGKRVAEAAARGNGLEVGVASGLSTGMTQPTSQVRDTTKTKTLVRLVLKPPFQDVFDFSFMLPPIEINTLPGYWEGCP
jgi:hypothetical protein